MSDFDKKSLSEIVNLIKTKKISSLEVTSTLADKHKLKIKINNSLSSAHSKENEVVKVDHSPLQEVEFTPKATPQKILENTSVIKSPMVGTVYLSPSPEEPTFIQVGKKIKKGDTMLIIEAMKTMNHIPSTLEGTVKEILVNNESPVEFDTPLVIIEP